MNEMRKLMETMNRIDEDSKSTRFVIRNNETGQFRFGTGKHAVWIDNLQDASVYKNKPTSLWQTDNMEMIPVKIVPIHSVDGIAR